MDRRAADLDRHDVLRRRFIGKGSPTRASSPELNYLYKQFRFPTLIYNSLNPKGSSPSLLLKRRPALVRFPAIAQ